MSEQRAPPNEQPLGPGRIVLLYVPDIRKVEQPITPFPAVVVEVDPETGRVSLSALFPWDDRPDDRADYKRWQPNRERVVEGESRAWRWDWPNLKTWAWKGP